ncbi:MAG: EAL domain-containing protein [Coriobacteriia bacterium]|nr:EAL domain-containing protein [Coriobacteriia bacterium]
MKKHRGRRTILVVEDNDLNREVLCAFLSERYNTLQAANGQEALDLLKEHHAEVSLIILDIQMPVMDGYGFLEVQQHDVMLRDIPVMVATASDSFNEEERCLKLGAVDFVTKPYQPSVVLCRVSNIIRLRETSSTLDAVETDPMTGLYVKAAFLHYARDLAMLRAQNDYDMVVFAIADLSMLNEVSGTAACDKLIKETSRTMIKHGAPDMLACLAGGSTFALLFERRETETARELAERITSEVNASSTRPASRLSAGICPVEDADSVDVAYERALRTARSARDAYSNQVAEYDDTVRAEDERRIRIESSMELALECGEFKVFYQPKHNAQTGKVVGAEALVRWVREKDGYVSPAEFVPLLESNGFIAQVDRYVWYRTVQNQVRWRNAGLDLVRISVNASNRDFVDGTFAQDRVGIVTEAGLDPRYMSVEVTESLFADNVGEVVSMLDALRSQGICVELDDFGSGYSSLGKLLSFPLDVVKLDLSFMRGLEDPRRLRLLEMCIQLLKGLGFHTVSEGVETAEQAELIRKLGGDVIQGYYYSKPLSEEDFEQYLKDNA